MKGLYASFLLTQFQNNAQFQMKAPNTNPGKVLMQACFIQNGIKIGPWKPLSRLASAVITSWVCMNAKNIYNFSAMHPAKFTFWENRFSILSNTDLDPTSPKCNSKLGFVHAHYIQRGIYIDIFKLPLLTGHRLFYAEHLPAVLHTFVKKT